MARSLFHELRDQQNALMAPSRLQPNALARLARFSWRNAAWVLLAWAAIATAAATLAINRAVPPTLEQLPIPIRPVEPAGPAAGFSRLDALQTITVSNRDPALLDEQRGDLLQTLRQRRDVYELVFSPGFGDYYESHGLLYRPLEEIKGRVAYALSLKPLFNAVAQAPSASSMSTLVSEIAAGIKQGRDPQGLDDLLAASADSVQALMKGEDKPVDWAAIADLETVNTTSLVTILALPKPGQTAAANALTLKLLNILRSSSDSVTELNKTEPSVETPASAPVEWPRAASAALMGLVFAGLLLALSLGRTRMAIVILVPALITAGIVAVGFCVLIGPAWLSFWPLALGMVMLAGVLGLHYVLSIAEHSAGRGARETSIMLAAQFDGTEVLWLAGLMTAPWLGLFVLRAGLVTQLTGFVLATSALTALCVLTLIPAAMRFLPQAANWRAREWLVPAHRALFETGQWQFLGRALGVLMVAAALAVIFGVQSNQARTLLGGPVTLVAGNQIEAEAAIARLKKFPSAQGVRWLAMFQPQEAQQKIAELKPLKDQFPRITPVQSESADDLRDQIETLQESLKQIGDASSANAKLRKAADDFRRSLALLGATSDDRQVRLLENRLFGGFNRLADKADELATLDAPVLTTLPGELRTLFGTPEKALRIEVIPAAGISNAALALTLEEAGFNVLHPAVAQESAAAARLHAVLWVLGAGIGIASLLIMFAIGNTPALTRAGFILAASLIVLTAAERLWQSDWTLSWLLAVLAILSALAAALYNSRRMEGSTAVTAVNLFLIPAVAMALVAPFQALGIGAVADVLLPPAFGLAIVAAITGLLQRHAPLVQATAEDEAEAQWQDFEI